MSDQPSDPIRTAERLLKVLLDDGNTILDEVDGRLDADLSRRDEIAISTAISKAVIQGANRGLAEATARFMERLPPDIKITHDLILKSNDEWAERYGGDAA